SPARFEMGGPQYYQSDYAAGCARPSCAAAKRWWLGSTPFACERRLCDGAVFGCAERGRRFARNRSGLQARDRIPSKDATGRRIVVCEEPSHTVSAFL